MRTARPAPVLALITTAILLVAGCGGSNAGTSTPTRPAAQGPTAVSAGALRRLADSVGHPVYWAGPRPGGYELTVDVNGNIFIRYLEGGEQVGSRRRTSLTIATYPFADAFKIVREASRGPGATVAQTSNGGLVVAREGSPRNAYIAYRGRNIQIEVYDPRPGRALELARAGAIAPIQ